MVDNHAAGDANEKHCEQNRPVVLNGRVVQGFQGLVTSVVFIKTNIDGVLLLTIKTRKIRLWNLSRRDWNAKELRAQHQTERDLFE